VKKIVIFVLVLVMTTGFAIAQDIGFSTAPKDSGSGPGSSGTAKGGSGISVGVEAGLIDFQPVYEELTNVYIKPMLSYDGYLSETLALNAELGFPFWIDPEFWLGVDLDLMLTLNMGNLSVIAGNALAIPVKPYVLENSWYHYDFTYSPMFGDIIEAHDTLFPGIKYNLSSGIGTLYFQASLPIRIIPDPFDYAGMNFSLGLNGNNGFRFWIREDNNLKPRVEFFRGLDLFASYNAGSLYGELYVEIPTYEGGMGSAGVGITPKVEFRFANGLKFYVELPIWGIGSERDTYFGLTVGAKMSF